MTRTSRWDASFGAQLRNTTRGMHLASDTRVHRVAWLVLWTACSEAPICELEPPSWDAATDVLVQVRGPDLGPHAVFVQDAEGLLLFEGVTAADGSLVVAEVPANTFLTVDVADEQASPQLVSYVGLQSGEVVAVGPSLDVIETGGAASVTVRFPQLELPTTAYYDVDFGRHCAGQSVIEHVPTPGTVQSIVLNPRCPGPAGFVTVVAADIHGAYLGAAGAAIADVPATGTLTVDVGPWNTATTSIEVATTRPAQQVMVLPEHDGYLRSVLAINDPGTSVPIPVTGNEIDATLLRTSFSDQRHTIRTTTSSSLTITDADLLPPVAVDAQAPGDAALSIAWRYTGPVTAAVVSYSINVAHIFRLSREVVVHDPGCSLRVPPLPPRSRYQIPDLGHTDLFELAGVGIVYAPDLSRDAIRKLVIDDYDQPFDVPVRVVDGFDELQLVTVPDPS